MRVINAHADRTGKKVMYAFNLTGEIDEMLRRHDQVVAAGGTCVMVSLNSVGLGGRWPICAATAGCRSTRTATAGACTAATRCSA